MTQEFNADDGPFDDEDDLLDEIIDAPYPTDTEVAMIGEDGEVVRFEVEDITFDSDINYLKPRYDTTSPFDGDVGMYTQPPEDIEFSIEFTVVPEEEGDEDTE